METSYCQNIAGTLMQWKTWLWQIKQKKNNKKIHEYADNLLNSSTNFTSFLKWTGLSYIFKYFEEYN